MRLLRALAHLVLALVVLTGAVAQARAAGCGPAPQPHAHHAMMAGTGHDHGSPTAGHPAHGRDGCQAACCLAPAPLPERAPDLTAAEFFSGVRYADAALSASGRSTAPDPGIPKRNA
jgi:hypothetical protein